VRRIEARREPEGDVLEAVAEVVLGGGTVIFPTDSVYGIGCDPQRPEAVARIFALKGRPLGKPLALHVASVAEFLEYAAGNALAEEAARAFLPGPLTLVVARPAFVDARVTAGLPTLGLRVPNHPLCLAILERCGPLAATSANMSGMPSYTGANAAGLPEADLLVDDGPTPFRTESTILDVSQAVPRLVREGVIPTETLERRLGPIALLAVRAGAAETR
jgi:L-threonylcarbamoyladenylate synthase